MFAPRVGCIDSAADWVSEIVVVDMESSDDTVEIAESFGAKVIHVPAAGWAEPGRQSGLDAAERPRYAGRHHQTLAMEMHLAGWHASAVRSRPNASGMICDLTPATIVRLI